MKVQSTRIYMEDGCKAGVLTIENGKITAFTPGTDPEAVDYGDKRIIPGIFDTHNHATCGFNPGEDFGTLEERKALVKGYLKALASQGTVNVFPTVTPVDAIAAVAAVHDEGPQDGANILGIHSEGPWLSRVGEGHPHRLARGQRGDRQGHGRSRPRPAAAGGAGPRDPGDRACDGIFSFSGG